MSVENTSEKGQIKSVGSGSSGSADRDWPEDADHENGNYSNKCLGCGEYFVGHKRRVFCRKCSDASKARWESLTPEQRADEQRKADAELTAWLSSQNVGGEPPEGRRAP